MNSNERKKSVGWEARQLEIDKQLFEETAGYVTTENHTTMNGLLCRSNRPTFAPGEGWWSWPGLNRRPRECHSRALPTALQPHSQAKDKGS